MSDGDWALLFPGQGSQEVGMGRDFYEQSDAAREIFERADRRLGETEEWDHGELSELCFEGPEEKLRLTAITQPAVLTASYASWRAFAERVPEPDYLMGHSLGEYTALVAGGALDFEDAVELVFHRGRFMQSAVPEGEGAMAAVIGLEPQVVEEVCEQLAITGREDGGRLSCMVANFNAPTQQVISGDRQAVESAAGVCEERGAKRVVELDVSAPFHSSLMQPAAAKLEPMLNRTHFEKLEIPVIANLNAQPYPDKPGHYRQLLQDQIHSPLLWSESVENLVEHGVDKGLEVGPGRVLRGLCRRIDRSLSVVSVSTPDDLDDALDLVGRRKTAGGEGSS